MKSKDRKNVRFCAYNPKFPASSDHSNSRIKREKITKIHFTRKTIHLKNFLQSILNVEMVQKPTRSERNILNNKFR